MAREELLSTIEISRITGISSQKLRYLDKCGKLIPVKRTDAGYRYYSQEQILEALKIEGKRVIVAYTLGRNISIFEYQNREFDKQARIENDGLIERVKKLEPNSKVIGVYDLWHGTVRGSRLEEVIHMAVDKLVEKIYFDNKDWFIFGKWDEYEYWLHYMKTELVDINDVDERSK